MARRKGERASLVQKLRAEVHAAWLAARDPRTPWYARAFGLLVTAYALSPIDLVPDFIPVLGLLDDAIIIPLGIWLFEKMLPDGMMEEHRATAAAAASRPGSSAGAIIVITVWLLLTVLIAWLWAWNY